jgi:hypothetical protein
MSKKKVLFPLLGKSYEAALIERLKLTGFEVKEVSDEESFEDRYLDFCYSLSGYFTLLIDVENSSSVLSVIQAFTPAKNRPKIILLTSFLSWCGETSNRYISDPYRDFCTRIPLQCALEAYGLENALWNMATDPLSTNITYFVGKS